MKRNSLLCPNCRKLVSKTADTCPHCGLRRPGSFWNNNFLTRGNSSENLVLRAVLIANVLLFGVSILIDPRLSSFSGNPFAFLSPSSNSLQVLGSTGAFPLFQRGSWWTLISASYLHGSLMHILFNMIALHQLGPLLIREYGQSRTFVIYTMSGIGGYLVSAVFGVQLTIGASAAVCGLIGGALYYGKSRGGAYGKAVYSQISGWALGIFLFGFIVPGINNWGHGGGMACGALMGYLLGYQERNREKMIHTYLAIGCAAATLAVLALALARGGLFVFLRLNG